MAIEIVNFVTPLHTASKRDYFARMNAGKPGGMRVAKQYGKDYWDGDRKYGYGGYHNDGRWKPVAEAMIKHYGLDNQSYILDIGCGKGFLLKEFGNQHTTGLDCSAYALDSASNEAQMYLGSSTELPFRNDAFTLTYSINVFHNLNYKDLKLAVKEMMRVSRDKRYICVESYRTEEELCNLQCWALTCQSFYTPDDWRGILEDNGYSGDLELIYFT